MIEANTVHNETEAMHKTGQHIEMVASPRWVRVLFGGEYIANSQRVLLMREKGHTPVYYFPEEDVRTEFLQPTDHTTHCPYKGDAVYWTITVGDQVAENAVWSYPEPLEEAPDLTGYLAFDWEEMDAWFEENEEIFLHPRDPFKRVDALPSSRHVEVEVNGVTVGESSRPVILFETGLPPRYYLPKTDVRQDLLIPGEKVTVCPYKGKAHYYSVKTDEEINENIAWYYRYPKSGLGEIENHICFYDERVDAVYVDGERQPKPETPFA